MIGETKTLIDKQNAIKVDVLAQSGVFVLKEGKVEINVHNGQIQSVTITERKYKRIAKGLPL